MKKYRTYEILGDPQYISTKPNIVIIYIYNIARLGRVDQYCVSNNKEITTSVACNMMYTAHKDTEMHLSCWKNLMCFSVAIFATVFDLDIINMYCLIINNWIQVTQKFVCLFL